MGYLANKKNQLPTSKKGFFSAKEIGNAETKVLYNRILIKLKMNNFLLANNSIYLFITLTIKNQ